MCLTSPETAVPLPLPLPLLAGVGGRFLLLTARLCGSTATSTSLLDWASVVVVGDDELQASSTWPVTTLSEALLLTG